MDTSVVVIDPLELGTRLIGVLNHGLRTSTYKFAALMALIQYCQGTAPTQPPEAALEVPVDELTAHVMDIYWPQIVPDPKTGKALRQSSGDTTILHAVRTLRDAALAADPKRPCPNVKAAKSRVQAVYDKTLRTVRNTLLDEPLPKLQHQGRGPYTAAQWFLYDEDQISRKSEVINLKPGVAYGLAKLALMLRPVIETYWVDDVLRTNDKQYKSIRGQLFGHDRKSLKKVGTLLRRHEKGCFYCGQQIVDRYEVDHVLPWSAFHLDVVANLVIACQKCNSSKSDYPPALDHLDRALKRPADILEDIAAQVDLDVGSEAMKVAAKTLYDSASVNGRDVWWSRDSPSLIAFNLSTAPKWMREL